MTARVANVRAKFCRLLAHRDFTSINREASLLRLVGGTTIEIVNASFIADEEAIFGTVNQDYIKREEAWYRSQSLNVNDIPGGPPAVWSAVADPDGFINSNYGWCIFSRENGSQFKMSVAELINNPESRRAIMIYTRPNMWSDFNKNGRSDFMCTNTVQYLIRHGAIHAVVQMRSNDAVFGYKNDRAWQLHVLEQVTKEVNDHQQEVKKRPYAIGKIYWNVGSLHVYARHFHLVDPEHYSKS